MARVALLQVVPILLILSMSCAASALVVSPKGKLPFGPFRFSKAAKSLQFVQNKCNSLSNNGTNKIYVEFCERTLSPRATVIAENDVRMAQSALGVDLNYAKKAETTALQVIRENRVQAKEKEAVNLCLSGIKEVLSTLRKTSRELQKPRPVVGQYNVKINQSLEKCSEKLVTPSIKDIIDEVDIATSVAYLLYH